MNQKEAAQQKTHHQGLSSEQVLESRRIHGVNLLTPPAREPWWKLFLEKFEDPVIRILIIAAVLAIVAGIAEGNFTEGIGIIVAILLATILAFVNEYKAGQEFDILNKTNDDVLVKVIRDGVYLTVPKRDIVVDDIVLVEIGEEVPADGAILEAVSLQVDESQITGESEPARKRAAGQAQPAKEGAAYPPDQVLRGTFVADGHGVLQITAVGDGTEIGKTAHAAAEETEEVTPLNRQLQRLSKVIGVFGFGAAALTYTALVVHGTLVGEIVLSAQGWVLALLLIAGGMVALVRVWLPVFYDAFELLGRDAEPPAWLEEGGLKHWGIAVGLGAGLAFAGLAVGMITGFLPADPAVLAAAIPGDVVRQLLEFFMIAVTIIVVAVPEGLAMSVTLSLAYSMRKMTATNNLVRKMHACETIGAATVICSDKTGTLTLNEMRVDAAMFPLLGEDAPARGEGSGFALIAEAIAANSTANLSRQGGQPAKAIGNPTEGALLLWLEERGANYVMYRDAFAVAYQWTFSTERKYMATLGRSAGATGDVLHVKGAPEIVLERCVSVRTPAGDEPVADRIKAIENQLREIQLRGMRTIGLAYKPMSVVDEQDDLGHIATDLIWLGFVAIVDPVRDEVPHAIEVCGKAGIAVKIVTGDHSHTAQEIARRIGLWKDGEAAGAHLTGPEFNALPDDRAAEAALGLKILSRARPLDKLRLVKLLKAQKQIVAVTGDGTNDAPALNYADVGLAMGKNGTAVAKEASDIILLDDSFRSIVNAVMWGRSLYENIQRFILFQLTINVAALVIALLGPFIGVSIPLTVVQMLWVNLIMDTFAALALATEPPHAGVLDRPPREQDAFIVTKPMLKNILATASVFIMVLIGLLLWVKGAQAEVEHTYRLTIFFSIFVMLQFWNIFNARCLGHNYSAFHRMFENKLFVAIAAFIFVGQILIIQFGGSVFRTVPLSLGEWVSIVGGTSVVLWLGEIVRLVRRVRSHE